jgi:hypothetical protein
MGQIALVAPAGTITEDGMEDMAEPPLMIARATEVSSAAGAFNVTLAVVCKPPRTPVPITLTGCGGFRVRVAGALYVPSVSVRVTTVLFTTEEVG